jgi:hypothetical protein
MLHPAPSACAVLSPGQRVDLGSTARMVDRAGRHKTQRPDQDIHLANPGGRVTSSGKGGSTCLLAVANFWLSRGALCVFWPIGKLLFIKIGSTKSAPIRSQNRENGRERETKFITKYSCDLQLHGRGGRI